MKSIANVGERLKNIFIKVFLILILFYSTELTAQTPPGDCPCDPDDPDYDACAALFPECDPSSVPIDSEVEWLLCGGAVLAFFAFHKRARETHREAPLAE